MPTAVEYSMLVPAVQALPIVAVLGGVPSVGKQPMTQAHGGGGGAG